MISKRFSPTLRSPLRAILLTTNFTRISGRLSNKRSRPFTRNTRWRPPPFHRLYVTLSPNLLLNRVLLKSRNPLLLWRHFGGFRGECSAPTPAQHQLSKAWFVAANSGSKWSTVPGLVKLRSLRLTSRVSSLRRLNCQRKQSAPLGISIIMVIPSSLPLRARYGSTRFNASNGARLLFLQASGRGFVPRAMLCLPQLQGR